MGKLFNMDSPLMRFATKLADLMILNVLFLLTCIPVVTIGAAWTALYYVTLQMIRNEEGGIVRGYFHSFKQNFRQATVLWLGVLAAAVLLLLDIRLLNGLEDSTAVMVMNAGVVLIALLIVMTLQYLFPTLAKFDNTLPATARNAFLLALGNLPKTVLMIVFSVLLLVLTFMSTNALSIAIPLWLVLGFSVSAYIKATFLMPIFDKCIKTEQETAPNEEINC